jgi:hypothetical protein
MPDKKLKTLDEYNREKMMASDYENSGNGIACPSCGKELVDSQPGVALLTDPQRYAINCPACFWSGLRR